MPRTRSQIPATRVADCAKANLTARMPCEGHKANTVNALLRWLRASCKAKEEDEGGETEGE